MNREELKSAIKKAYDKGYHNGFADACDTITPALIEATTDIVAKLKEAAHGAKCEAFDEEKESGRSEE